MLSAYMRFKYPNIVAGSIAASAPILLLTPTADRSFFWKLVTKDFNDATPSCQERVQQAFVMMKDLAAQGATGGCSLVLFYCCNFIAVDIISEFLESGGSMDHNLIFQFGEINIFSAGKIMKSCIICVPFLEYNEDM